MSYYGQNVDALLWMGASTADPLPSAASDTLTEVPLTQVITPPAWEKSVGFFNVLNDGNKRSIGGKLAEQIIEGNIVLDHSNAVHLDMIADAQATGQVKRNWRITYPDGWTLDFVGFISRMNDEAFDATGDAKEHIASYRLAVDGAVTTSMNTP
jgi:hypothetical protein